MRSAPLTAALALCTLHAFADEPRGPLLEPARKAGPRDEPWDDEHVDGTTAAVSAGGLFAAGNAKSLAGSASAAVEPLSRDWGFGASLVGSYGQGAPAGKAIAVNTENVQARVRGDRYVAEDIAVFVLNTGRYDRFQGLDLRYNLDPGARLLVVREAKHATWAEVGYDFQRDVRRDDARNVTNADGSTSRLDKTAVQHGFRVFVGRREAFRDDVTLTLGLELVQDVTDSSRYRVVGEGVFASRISGGLSLGLGATARYERTPLPGKERLDATTTLNLVYAFSDAGK